MYIGGLYSEAETLAITWIVTTTMPKSDYKNYVYLFQQLLDEGIAVDLSQMGADFFDKFNLVKMFAPELKFPDFYRKQVNP